MLLFALRPQADDYTGSTIIEPSAGSYARVPVVSNNINWSNPSTETLSNATTILFNTATGNWGTITGIAIVDAATVGNMLFWAALSVSKTVSTGDVIEFLATSLTIQMDS